MPVLVITNRTATRLPVNAVIGILNANQVRTLTVTSNELEEVISDLVSMEAAGRITYTVNPSPSAADNQAEPVLGGAKVLRGSGIPNNVVVGSVGDLFVRSDGGANTTLWVKESGNDTDTGWVAK